MFTLEFRHLKENNDGSLSSPDNFYEVSRVNILCQSLKASMNLLKKAFNWRENIGGVKASMINFCDYFYIAIIYRFVNNQVFLPQATNHCHIYLRINFVIALSLPTLSKFV